MADNLFIFNFNIMIKILIYKIKKNPYKFFLVKLVVLFTIIFSLDFFIGNILGYFYFKQESGLQYRTTYSIEKTTADLLIFGSSRANHHYYPTLFEKRLNLSYYNVGRDGNFMFYHSAVLKGVLKRYSPKIIILDFIGKEFEENQNSYDRLSSLLPYYKTHPEMRSIIELKSKYERLKMPSFIYPYNSSIFTIAIGNTEFNKRRKGDIKGYIPLNKTLVGSIEIDSSSSKYEIDSIKIKAYESFIQDCKNSNVKLYIVCSPYFTSYNHSDYSLIIAKEIAKRNNIQFFDYSNDSTFLNKPQLFADISHLNEEGSKLFSNMLIDSIQKTIEKESK
ncbi:MAG: hypothetical protein A2X12_07550 [Bacteroidetes bacterium GWE2_29_8]|nr:MAG: hypothetical protein A2X12_07550 [Bacteroidetes bacterium GWE2_29_8]OFY22064.1 MAG: hypothetical protein A2X02_04455 [Bacteroidetes bacterium GWF2_29_10]